ncbi:TIGR04104 family putative zinc finger protein [Oceanobacillus sp. FSL K6-2867]|uniref:TIGR04104 family putative zinc finger protein n=1 Tax=Oceanobacillus sp. FSL K6-2867 TaxID=2954748 RepID=UPI0030DC8625
METPACAYCKKQWSYWMTLKNLLRIKMSCPHCGKENYYDSTKSNSFLTLMLAPALIIIGSFLNVPLGWLFGISILLILFHFLFYPFRTKVRKAD